LNQQKPIKCRVALTLWMECKSDKLLCAYSWQTHLSSRVSYGSTMLLSTIVSRFKWLSQDCIWNSVYNKTIENSFSQGYTLYSVVPLWYSLVLTLSYKCYVTEAIFKKMFWYCISHNNLVSFLRWQTITETSYCYQQ
jgi:hypothetical protein